MYRRESGLVVPRDPFRHFVTRVPFYVAKARTMAAEDAYSYRKFHVGGAIYADEPTTEEEVEFWAGNLKVRQERDKVCAEKKLTIRAEKSGMTRAIGYVAVGTTDVDLIQAVTEKRTPTLHMCSDCRDLLSSSYLVQDHTIVVTAGLTEDKYQVHSFGQMRDMYAEDSEATDFEYSHVIEGFDNWDARVAAYDRLVQIDPRPTDETRSLFARIALTGAAGELS